MLRFFRASTMVCAMCFSLIGLTLSSSSWAQALAPTPTVKVVATFSILGDMVAELGADRITLRTIVGPEQDAHGYEPSPNDVRALNEAQMLVSNGLGFESWLNGLMASADFRGISVVASEGSNLRQFAAALPANHNGHGHGHDDDHNDGTADPHAWQDLRNGQIYAKNITQGLIRLDPEGAGYYQRRLADYLARMSTLDKVVHGALGSIAQNKRKVVSSHDAFGYFSAAYGVSFIPVAGLAGKAEVSAREVAHLIDTVRKESIAGVFVESGSNARLVEQIARETGARVGGTLYSDALATPGHPADTYLGIFRWNTEQLMQVLAPKP